MMKTRMKFIFAISTFLTAAAFAQSPMAPVTKKSGPAATARKPSSRSPSQDSSVQKTLQQQVQPQMEAAPAPARVPRSKRLTNPQARPPRSAGPAVPTLARPPAVPASAPAPLAAPAPVPPPEPVPLAAPVVARSENSSAGRDSYWEPGIRVTLSQETVVATRTTTTTVNENMLTQSQGTTLSLKYKKLASNIRWVWTYGLEFALGTIRFKGTSTDIPDQVINPWYMFSFNPGIIFRTAPSSSFGVSFPVGYRIIKWPIDDPTLSVSRAASIGYGAQFTFLSHFTTNSSLHVSFTHQAAFQSTVWAVGYEYAFR